MSNCMNSDLIKGGDFVLKFKAEAEVYGSTTPLTVIMLFRSKMLNIFQVAWSILRNTIL